MYPCNYPGCEEKFENHTFLMNHILRDHAAQMFAAVLVALVITLALLVGGLPATARAQQSPQPQPTPAVGGGPVIFVEGKVFLPLVTTGDSVKAAVSWCPSCRG